MISLDALYAGTLAAASRATYHLGPLGVIADRLADRVLPQSVAKASCNHPRLCAKWLACNSNCNGWWSCGLYCEGDTWEVCEATCLCTSSPCG